MVALEEEWTGFGLVAVQSPSGRPWNLDVIVQRDAIANDGHVAADQGNIEAAPLAQAERYTGRRWIPAINRTHFMGRLATAFGADLDFVAPTQVDPAIAAFRAIDLDMQFEIVVFAGRFQVRRSRSSLPLDLGVIVHQFAVAPNPFVVLNVSDGLPSGEIFAIE